MKKFINRPEDVVEDVARAGDAASGFGAISGVKWLFAMMPSACANCKSL